MMHTNGRSMRQRVPRVASMMIAAFIPAACAGAPSGGTAAIVTPAPATAVPTAAATVGVDPATQRPTSAPAIEMTFEPATEAPAAAIAIEMTIVNTPVFRPDEITAPAGTVQLFLTNLAPLQELHNFQFGSTLRQTQAETRAILPQESVVVTLPDLAPGTYAYWCNIARHDSLGMVGTLTVTR